MPRKYRKDGPKRGPNGRLLTDEQLVEAYGKFLTRKHAKPEWATYRSTRPPNMGAEGWTRYYDDGGWSERDINDF